MFMTSLFRLKVTMNTVEASFANSNKISFAVVSSFEFILIPFCAVSTSYSVKKLTVGIIQYNEILVFYFNCGGRIKIPTRFIYVIFASPTFN
jgi:hypothetical protein